VEEIASLHGEPDWLRARRREAWDVYEKIGMPNRSDEEWRRVDLKGFKSRPLTKELVEEVTHIFTMARHHLEAVEEEFPEASGKVYLVSEFATEDMLRNQDVSDPFGAPRRYYDDTRWMLEKLLPTVQAYIEQTWKAEDKA